MVELTLHIIPRKYKVKVLDRKDQKILDTLFVRSYNKVSAVEKAAKKLSPSVVERVVFKVEN